MEHTRALVLGVVIVAELSAGCSSSDWTRPTTTAPAERSLARDDAQLETGRRLQVLATFDAIEVEHGHAAIMKASAPAVRAFADALVTLHGRAREQRAQLAALNDSELVDSALSRQLAARGQTTLQALLGSDAEHFDRLYLKTRIEQRQALLQWLGEQLERDVQGRERDDLLETRELAEHQRNLAQQVYASLSR